MPAGDAGLEQGPVTLLHDAYAAMVDEIDRLQAQLAAQQAVVEAARAEHPGAVLHRWMNPSCRLCAALDAAQAAQPEGER